MGIGKVFRAVHCHGWPKVGPLFWIGGDVVVASGQYRGVLVRWESTHVSRVRGVQGCGVIVLVQECAKEDGKGFMDKVRGIGRLCE